MSISKLMIMTVLVLLLLDFAYAGMDKKTTDSNKKTAIIDSPESVESKGKGAKNDSLKRRIDALFNRIDANRDSKVSHDEYMMPDELFFEKSDSNHDGFLTKEELQNALKKRMRNQRYKMMREQLQQKQPSK